MARTAILALDRVRQTIIRDGLAATGTNAATALPLTGTWHRITSVPAGSGVRLMPASVGMEILIVRADYGNPADLAIYADGSDTLGHFSGGAITLVGGFASAIRLACMSDGIWDIIGSVGDIEAIDAAKLDGRATVTVSAKLVDRQARATLAARGAVAADAHKAA